MEAEIKIVEKTTRPESTWETDVVEKRLDEEKEHEGMVRMEISTDLHHSMLSQLQESDCSVFVRVV